VKRFSVSKEWEGKIKVLVSWDFFFMYQLEIQFWDYSRTDVVIYMFETFALLHRIWLKSPDESDQSECMFLNYSWSLWFYGMEINSSWIWEECKHFMNLSNCIQNEELYSFIFNAIRNSKTPCSHSLCGEAMGMNNFGLVNLFALLVQLTLFPGSCPIYF